MHALRFRRIRIIERQQMKTQQFELWTQCNNNCSYCYLGKRRFAGTPEQKIQNMNFALDWMRQYEHYDEYNNVSFIGGEFFQGQLDTPEVKAKWIELMEQMQDLFENDLITASWISATLTIGDQQDLFDTLKMFEGICTHQKQLWIVTSYDTIGRFHSKENLENWKHNMKEIKKRFPWVYLNTCMIITDDFCKKIISGELDLRAFREEYQTHLFIKPPYPIDDGNPHSLGLYELTGVDEAVANYIGTHLALTDSGLWVAGDVNSDYRILLSPQGMIVYGPQGIVSQFGENITFSSDSAQRIGGNNSYIEFDPQTGKLNIVADDIHIGEVDAGASLDDQKQKLDELTGYVDINPLEGYIRVGKKDADSYVQVDGDGKVSINIEGDSMIDGNYKELMMLIKNLVSANIIPNPTKVNIVTKQELGFLWVFVH